MCATREAWIVAMSVGVVHAMKDQGFCRWGYAMRSINQHAKTNMRSFLLQAQNLTSSSAAVFDKMNSEKKNQPEESLRKVMYLSCWGPYQIDRPMFFPATCPNGSGLGYMIYSTFNMEDRFEERTEDFGNLHDPST